MRPSVRVDTLLRALAMLFLAATAWAVLVPPALPDTTLSPAGLDASPPPGVPGGPPDADVQTGIIDANIFSDSRRPPATRYDPFAPDPEPADVRVDRNAAGRTPDEAAVPRLYGIVFRADGPSALMRLDPDLPGAQLYREGDRVGRYHVVRINEQSVILDTSDGRIVLQLFRSGTSLP